MEVRVPVKAEALYTDGLAAIHDLSLSGIGLEGSSLGFVPGQELNMILTIGSEWYGPFRYEVVWVLGRRAGMKFLKSRSDAELKRAIRAFQL